jgi:ABC-2 type transport system permease protein
MSLRRVRALTKKEFIQISRDIRSLIGALFLPLLMISLYGYALSLDVDRIPTMVFDRDESPAYREFVGLVNGSRYFQIVGYITHNDEIDQALMRGDALMVLVLPERFSSKLKKGFTTPIQVILDGSDSNTATLAEGYIKTVAARFDLKIQKQRVRRAGLRLADIPVEARTRVWFNPEMKSRNFIIPGLTAIIMMAICCLMTALSVSREKETGTLEQILSTPISSGEVIAGKLLPYIAVGLVDMVLVVGAGVLIFRVPFHGSYLTLFLAAFIFLIGTLSWGLFLSIVSRTQLQAGQLAVLSAILPSFLLSGFIYPIENMPLVLQCITFLVPGRYFVEILRGLFLQGIGLTFLWPQVLALLIFAILVLQLAVRAFSKRLV